MGEANQNYEYDFAFSYAEPDGEYVAKVVTEVRHLGWSVFHYKDHFAKTLGKNLCSFLGDIYKNKAQYTVAFVSRHYAESPWPQFEWRCIQDRAVADFGEYLIPARFDLTPLAGLHSTTGYADLNRETPASFARLLAERISRERPQDCGRLESLFDRALAIQKVELERRRDTVSVEEYDAPRPFGRHAILRCSDMGRSDVHHLFAIPTTPERPTVDAAAELVTAVTHEGDAPPRAHLFYAGPVVQEEVLNYARRKEVFPKTLLEAQGHIDFRKFLDQQMEDLLREEEYSPGAYVQQRLQWLPCDAYEQAENAVSAVRDALAVEHGQTIVILGEFGTGKTFAMHELVRELTEGKGRVVPVLIKLGQLRSWHTLRELINVRIGGKAWYLDRQFEQMLEDGRIALLFDGFDEITLRTTFDEATRYLDVLLGAARGQAKVVITCRSQHFLRDRQLIDVLEKKRNEIPPYRVARMVPFGPRQIREFLEFRLGSEMAAQRRWNLLSRIRGLQEIASNPRMLGFLARIEEGKLQQAMEEDDSGAVAEVYDILIDDWIRHEVNRAAEIGDGPSREQLEEAMNEIAVLMWSREVDAVPVQDQPAWLTIALEGTELGARSAARAEHQGFTGGLMVRASEGDFRFIHDSLMEHLVGRIAAEELTSSSPRQVRVLSVDREPSELMVESFVSSVLRSERFRLEKYVQAFGTEDGTFALLKLASFFGRTPVRRSMLADDLPLLPEAVQRVVDPEQAFEDAVQVFDRAHLASGDGEGFRVYPLVRILVRRLCARTRETKWKALALRIVTAAYPRRLDSDEALEEARGLEAHALAVTSRSEEVGPFGRASELLDLVGQAAFLRDDAPTAKSAFLAAIADATKESGGVRRGIRIQNLAAAQASLGEFSAAVNSYRSAMRVNERHFVDDHCHHARVLARFGLSLARIGDSDGAMEALQSALRLLHAQESRAAVPILDGLGVTFLENGHPESALQALERARRIESERRAAPGSEAMAAIRAGLLARVHNLSGRRDRADLEAKMAESLWSGVRRRLATYASAHLVNAVGGLDPVGEGGFRSDLLARSIRKDLVDPLDAVVLRAREEHEAATRRLRELRLVQARMVRLDGDPVTRSAPTSDDDWADLEDRLLREEMQVDRLAEEVRGAVSLRDDFRQAAETLGFRWALQIPPCGLCAEAECLALSPCDP